MRQSSETPASGPTKRLPIKTALVLSAAALLSCSGEVESRANRIIGNIRVPAGQSWKISKDPQRDPKATHYTGDGRVLEVENITEPNCHPPACGKLSVANRSPGLGGIHHLLGFDENSFFISNTQLGGVRCAREGEGDGFDCNLHTKTVSVSGDAGHIGKTKAIEKFLGPGVTVWHGLKGAEERISLADGEELITALRDLFHDILKKVGLK